jgi:hypothetical protein
MNLLNEFQFIEAATVRDLERIEGYERGLRPLQETAVPRDKRPFPALIILMNAMLRRAIAALLAVKPCKARAGAVVITLPRRSR